MPSRCLQASAYYAASNLADSLYQLNTAQHTPRTEHAPSVFSCRRATVTDGSRASLAFTRLLAHCKLQARKIAEIPFPFPYAQMILDMLLVFCIAYASTLEGIDLQFPARANCLYSCRSCSKALSQDMRSLRSWPASW